MKQLNFDAFQELLAGVYSFYRADFSRFALDVWWRAMQHHDLEAVQDALGRHCVNPDKGQFLPKPADIVRLLEGSTLDSAILAWTKVERAVSAVGTYATVVFDDPLIHSVLADMGGWPQLGQKSIDEWPFVAKEFQTRYRGYMDRNAVGAYPPKLTGVFDQRNAQQGFDLQVPVLIGDAEKAMAVMRRGSTRPLLEITPLREHLALAEPK